MRNGLFLLGAGLLLASPAWAAPGPNELAAAHQAEVTGAEMFAYDQAAWHATDQLLSDLARAGSNMTAFSAKGARGYVIEPDESGGLMATFFGASGERRFALARYIVRTGAAISGGFVPPDGQVDLSLRAQRMIDARDKAIAAASAEGFTPCTQESPNTLVLPHRDGTIAVYLLSATRDPNSYPLGGHYRFDFDADGKLVGSRRFLKTCLNLDYRPIKDKRPSLAYVIHLLDPQPTEIHAFVSLNIPVPMVVGIAARKEMWGVHRGQVTFLKDAEAKPAAKP